MSTYVLLQPSQSCFMPTMMMMMMIIIIFVYSVIIVLICEFNSLSWIRHSLCSLDLSVECLFIAGFFSSGFVSLETSCSNCKIIKLLRGMHIIHE